MALATETPHTPSSVIDRITLVLDAFSDAGPLTLAQVVRRTGLPRSSAHRMLDRLVALRWLRRRDRTYELGLRLMELGSSAVHQDRLHQAALPFLHELRRATGLVVHLALLDGDEVLYLEKVSGIDAAMIPTRVGGRQPAHCTAVGKALLAATSAPIDKNVRLVRKTKFSIASPAQLTAELARIRAHGIAFDKEQSQLGVGCVAAPIGEPGNPLAAVSVCGPVERMPFDHRLASPVQTTALAIWRNLEHTPRRHTPPHPGRALAIASRP